MSKRKLSTSDNLSRNKKIIFNIVLFAIALLILCFIEITLRLFKYGNDTHLFLNNPLEGFENYKIVNPEIGAKYFSTIEYTKPTNDIFLKKKPENGIRIFVLGSSTAVGFPYKSNISFPRILEYRLQHAFPNKNIEVINTAITAINSYTFRDFTNEILAEKPDAILIYEGHNEFYGAFGIGSNEGIGKNHFLVLLHLKLMNLKLYQLLQNGIINFRKAIAGKSIPEQRGTLMSKIVRKADIEYGGSDYKAGIEQFNTNMSAILKKAQKHKIPLYISTLVSNIKDNPPFGSKGSEISERADSIYIRAKKAEAEGNFSLAKELYIKARDFDCIRFRASSDINKIIEDLASRYKAVLVPTLKRFEENSPNSIVGDNLLTEHLHPNISGYFLMADAFYDAIIDNKLIDDAPNIFIEQSSDYVRRNYGYTQLDSIYGNHLITNLKYHWPFRDESKSYIDYRLIYKPKNLIDSLAFNCMSTKTLTLLDAHITLAEIYKNYGDFYSAFREYNAITQLTPEWSGMYREAGKCLISAGDLPLALEKFQKASQWEETYYSYFRIAEIYMIMNDLENASENFLKSYKLSPQDYKINILSRLCLAYIYMGKNEDAKKVMSQIRDIEPGFKLNIPAPSYLFMNFVPIQIKTYIDKAKDLIKIKKSDEAIEILKEALKINDAPIANRMIGELYYQKKDALETYYYLQKGYDFFKFDTKYLHLMTMTNMINHKFVDAEKCLNQIKKIDPNYPALPRLIQILNQRSK